MLETGNKKREQPQCSNKKREGCHLAWIQMRHWCSKKGNEENNHLLLPSSKICIFLLLRSRVMTRQTHSEHEVNWFSSDRKLVMHFSIKKGSGVALKAGCKCHHAVAWQQMHWSLVSLFCTAKARELDFRVLMQMADTVVSSVTLTHRGVGLDQRAIPWLWSFNTQPSGFFCQHNTEECEEPPAGQSEPVASFHLKYNFYISVTS